MGNIEFLSCETVMTTEIPEVKYCVDTLIGPGLYIIAGEPKIGKSKLALDLCLNVAAGGTVLGLQTAKGCVLYYDLEDPLYRVQNRLFEQIADPVDNVYFSLSAGYIGSGLEESIEQFYQEHKDLRLVVIDTLQKVRENEESNYGTDYKELSSVKDVADKLGITIIVIHHTRKQRDTSPFKTIAGTTGLRGVADGNIVLVWTNEDQQLAMLYAEGRDVPRRKMEIQFDIPTQRWKLIADDLKEPEKFDDEVVTAIVQVMKELNTFNDSATTLTERVNKITKKNYDPKVVSRIMTQNKTRLEKLGVLFERRHSNGKRKLSIIYVENNSKGDDGADGDDIISPAPEQ